MKQDSASRERADTACEVLDRVFPGRVYTMRDAQYQSEVKYNCLDSIALGEENVLRVGPGQTWEQIYGVVHEKGRSVIGGRHGSVGIAGLLLGGGLSFFPSLFGMTVDSVINLEVVLSDSSIVNANRAENPDLYKVLKGGGANFGIVTRFDLKTYPRIDAQYTINAYDASDYVNILRATTRLQEAMENDDKIGFFLSSLVSWWQGCSTVVPTMNGTILDLVLVLDNVGATVLPARRALNAVSTKVGYELYLQVHERYTELLKNKHGTSNLSYTIQAIPSSVMHSGQRDGGNILGLNNMSQTWWACLMEWFEEPRADVAQRQISDLGDIIRSAARGTNSLLRYIVMNDAGSSQMVMDGYGPENRELLEHAAKKYDPNAIFQTQQNAGFLLG
ncbi:FAD-binding domain-containing protein [Xylariaceae sp. AK1471]|nr:FAD-binding domain-containing protein [Xylariaceae sp. AK1471]